MTTYPAQGFSGLAPEAPITPLIFDFLDWLSAAPRPYAEVMEVWRTSCPRLTVWEDAVDLGLVVRQTDAATRSPVVILTPAGRRTQQARVSI